MIGRRCKARERLSRAPLIGRALRDRLKVPSAPDRSQRASSSSAVRPPGRLASATPPKQPAPQRPPGAGGHGGRGTPGPIPNPEVKPASADGTAGATLWETRAPPAPGARCAGSGRGGAREAPGRGGPERVPLFVLRGFPALTFHRHAMRPPARPSGGWRPFASLVMRTLRLAPCAVEGAIPAVEALLAESLGYLGLEAGRLNGVCAKAVQVFPVACIEACEVGGS